MAKAGQKITGTVNNIINALTHKKTTNLSKESPQVPVQIDNKTSVQNSESPKPDNINDTQTSSRKSNQQNDEAAKARDAAAAEEDAARKAAYQAAINTGANRAAASAISSAGDTRGLQSNAASALRNAATSTQADYLNKMGYVEGLESILENTKAGSFLNILSGIGQGAMAGVGTGASIGGFLPF
jgi:hypothetical protein